MAAMTATIGPTISAIGTGGLEMGGDVSVEVEGDTGEETDADVGEEVDADVDVVGGGGVEVELGFGVEENVNVEVGRSGRKVNADVGGSVKVDVDVGVEVEVDVDVAVEVDVDVEVGAEVDVDVGSGDGSGSLVSVNSGPERRTVVMYENVNSSRALGGEWLPSMAWASQENKPARRHAVVFEHKVKGNECLLEFNIDVDR